MSTDGLVMTAPLQAVNDDKYAELAERWREAHASQQPSIFSVLGPHATLIGREPVRSCSYCRADLTGFRCGNCGAPSVTDYR